MADLYPDSPDLTNAAALFGRPNSALYRLFEKQPHAIRNFCHKRPYLISYRSVYRVWKVAGWLYPPSEKADNPPRRSSLSAPLRRNARCGGAHDARRQKRTIVGTKRLALTAWA
jgi:hypothetical protein